MTSGVLAYGSNPLDGFSGSYSPGDVRFLLKPMAIATISVAEKETLIQAGLRHYSEMISQEQIPSAEYAAIYEAALKAGKQRMGREAAALAAALARDVSGPITLASLVRAGVPLGVLLTRALREMGIDVAHFGISIIRGRGIDQVALDYIANQRPAGGIVFVDGWTGKGAIAGELERSLSGQTEIMPRLAVLADPCGCSWLAASGDDWLIPSGILGATVSGLLSRSILNDDISAIDFHGCMIWDHLTSFDVSRSFIETIWPHVQESLATAAPSTWTETDRAHHNTASLSTVQRIANRFEVDNLNRIKPGIAEATRAILRRMPERVFVSSTNDPDLNAILHLADKTGVEIEVNPNIAPYRAVTLIRKTS
jgi:hypothetical protein